MRYHEEKEGVSARVESTGSAIGTPRPPSVARATGRAVKKIPPHLRKERPVRTKRLKWADRALWRLRNDAQSTRSLVQAAFALLCIWVGVEFHLFVKWGLSPGSEPFVGRPPGVEGFLPISALISFRYWLLSGVLNDIHPSGLFILLAIVAVSIAAKKAFCSWMCPIGTLSESLWMLGRRLFKRTFIPWRWIDYPLRSLKYLLLLFFGWSIWQMDGSALSAFVYSPYNKMADVKMYLFFAHLSAFALGVILALVLLSLLIQNFWCRYLCPYGALLGILGWLSPLKITRTKANCIDCELCTKACPAGIKVHRVTRVWSDECMTCLACVDACPVKQTLGAKLSRRGTQIPGWAVGVLAVGVFLAVTGAAMLTGHWQNGIGREEYRKRFQQINSPVYEHNRGRVPAYGPRD